MEKFLVKISGFGIFARYFEARERIREKKKKVRKQIVRTMVRFRTKFFPIVFRFPRFREKPIRVFRILIARCVGTSDSNTSTPTCFRFIEFLLLRA